MSRIDSLCRRLSVIAIISCIVNVIICIIVTTVNDLPLSFIPYRTLIWVVGTALLTMMLHISSVLNKQKSNVTITLSLVITSCAILIEKAIQIIDSYAFSKIIDSTEMLNEINKKNYSMGTIVANYQRLNNIINICLIFFIIIIGCTAAKLALMYAVKRLSNEQDNNLY